MIFQDDCLFPHLSVAANIRFGLKGWPSFTGRRRLDHVAALSGSTTFFRTSPRYTFRRRAAAGRAGPSARTAPPAIALRRARLRPRSAQSPRNFGSPSGGPARGGDPLPLRHAQPGRGHLSGLRLFLLNQGRMVAEGPPLDVLGSARNASPGSIAWEGIRNVFSAKLKSHVREQGASNVVLENGPELHRPVSGQTPPGTPVLIEIGADDIILGPPGRGHAVRAKPDSRDDRANRVSRALAEAIVRTGGLTWIVSLVAPAIQQLVIEPGSEVQMIVKARSCHVVKR